MYGRLPFSFLGLELLWPNNGISPLLQLLCDCLQSYEPFEFKVSTWMLYYAGISLVVGWSKNPVIPVDTVSFLFSSSSPLFLSWNSYEYLFIWPFSDPAMVGASGTLIFLFICILKQVVERTVRSSKPQTFNQERTIVRSQVTFIHVIKPVRTITANWDRMQIHWNHGHYTHKNVLNYKSYISVVQQLHPWFWFSSNLFHNWQTIISYI